MIQKRDLNYLSGILLIFVFLLMFITGRIQIKFELHRFIYHIYNGYILIFLAVVHLITNWKKISILSIILIFSLCFTLISGFIQVKLNLPQSQFVYHIYSAYLTLILAFIHLCLKFKRLTRYLKNKRILVIVAITLLMESSSYAQEQIFERAMKYHKKTKHTYTELLTRTGGLNWKKQPSVFKKYPQSKLIKLSTDFDFDSISVEKAIEMGSFNGSFSGKPITKIELSRLLYYTNGITKTLRYPGLTYYLRAAPSAGALYPTVIYIVVSNVEGLKKGIYHYSVKEHALHFVKEGDFSEKLANSVKNPALLKNSSVVFIMSTIFYRTKWKYRERGYRYVLLDTGHVAQNLTLIARALNLGSYSIGTFIDDKINQMLEIDGLKEAVIYINAVGKISTSKDKIGIEETFLFEEISTEKLLKNLSIAELLHESGKLDSFKEIKDEDFKKMKASFKNYPKAKKIYLPKEFSKHGLNLDDAIRKRRSARDYSKKPISKLELSRLLYYIYGYIKSDSLKRAVWSIERLYPIEIYVVVNNVEGVTQGVYHYNVLEHALELLKKGDYRFKIANACLGQGLVGKANVAIIKTALFERVKPYGDRGYRYIHLDAGAIGENIYLEAVSMGLGVCGIGAFFDDQVNKILEIDGLKETVIYVTSIGEL